MFKKIALVAAIVAVFAVGVSPGESRAQIVAVSADSLTGIEKVARTTAPAVVSVIGYREAPVYNLELRNVGGDRYDIVMKPMGTTARKTSVGSGFFITSDGYVLTNRHVVDDSGESFVVDTGDDQYKASVVYKDPEYDLAVIKISGTGFPTIPLSDASVRVGQDIVSVGDAFGRYPDAISQGSVVSLDETIVAGDGENAERLAGLIETDAKLYPGNSGGPLLDSSGEAVGVNVAIIAGTDISFSIPILAARTVIGRAGIKI